VSLSTSFCCSAILKHGHAGNQRFVGSRHINLRNVRRDDLPLSTYPGLAALIVITYLALRRETLPVPSRDIAGYLSVLRPGLPGFLLLGLSLLVLVMCLDDHVAFFRFFAGLFRRSRVGRSGDLRKL